MSKLFETSNINEMQLSNRFVRSATWEGMAAEDGSCTPDFMALYTELAKGGVGLIITSHTFVRPDGKGSPRQLGLHKDELIPGLQDLTRAIHQHGSRVAVELSHAGILTSEQLTGEAPMVVSAVEDFSRGPGRELTVEDIQQLAVAFAGAAGRAKEAGFDAIQIHAAHGFLMSQFLSPAFNKRNDDYGGRIENRARALLEVLEKIRSSVGRDFPVLVKLNSEDFIDGGLTLEDSVRVGQMLQEEGIDAIEISGGTIVTGDHCQTDIDSQEKEAYWREAAKVFKEKLQQLMHQDYADYISMSRPFIREPGLVKRWASGNLGKATCLSDNLCRGPLLKGEGIYCVMEKGRKEKKS
jgi:2,4-dienoyl-CoA reductase-like NADH-dependent reductase (Old Yellow Enzyme family)